MKSRPSTALVVAVVLAATGLAACGKDDEGISDAPPPAATQTETTAGGDQNATTTRGRTATTGASRTATTAGGGKPATTAGGGKPATTGGGATVEVAADPDEKLAFEQDSLTAKAGSVTFAFTNDAATPHDFKIEKGGKDVDGTQVISQDEAEFTVDLEAGTYTYYCSVGTHRSKGMEGELKVE